MTLFQKILCAVDFSAASYAALAQARALAEQGGGRLTVLHVIEGFPSEAVYSGGRAAKLIDQYHGRADEVTHRLAALIHGGALNGRVDLITASGVAGDAIVAAAREREADLVVLGASQKARLDCMIAGSTVKAVVRHAHCAVLVIPEPRQN